MYTGQIGALAVTDRAHYNVKLHFFFRKPSQSVERNKENSWNGLIIDRR